MKKIKQIAEMVLVSLFSAACVCQACGDSSFITWGAVALMMFTGQVALMAYCRIVSISTRQAGQLHRRIDELTRAYRASVVRLDANHNRLVSEFGKLSKKE